MVKLRQRYSNTTIVSINLFAMAETDNALNNSNTTIVSINQN